MVGKEPILSNSFDSKYRFKKTIFPKINLLYNSGVETAIFDFKIVPKTKTKKCTVFFKCKNNTGKIQMDRNKAILSIQNHNYFLFTLNFFLFCLRKIFHLNF